MTKLTVILIQAGLSENARWDDETTSINTWKRRAAMNVRYVLAAQRIRAVRRSFARKSLEAEWIRLVLDVGATYVRTEADFDFFKFLVECGMLE